MTAPHLAGNFAPVPDELTEMDLPVTGAIPPELSGWYLRNGPNPAAAASAHWFLGDGMVHGVRVEGGRATSYRNRWVRTSTFTDGIRNRRSDGTRDLTAGLANTHVIRHAGRTLALVESSYPYELTRELDTVGPYDFDGELRTAMTAHPKTCPVTGELHFFGMDAREPYLVYHRADAAGNLVLSREIEVPGPTMHHDFNLTAEHVVFMDLPVVFDRQTEGMPFHWSETYPARLGVLRREDPQGAVRWFDIDPCYVFHVLNGHDEPGRIVLYVSRYDRLWASSSHDVDAATLWRWTIDLVSGTVTETQLDDRATEFPRLDDRLVGVAARFGHATDVGNPIGRTTGGALVRYDLSAGATVAHEFGPGRTPGEAAFAAADARPGGAGYLMTYVYDAATDRSDLVIVDADDLTVPAVATIHLPRRVPFGFHGSWLPDA
ncbi:9-cis-epoxycarotenoid dioxygenase [Nocardia panacis]|uniref:Dioxygenase n=1 Tax=Nocardia panacis TaxID=2340916 RepID=A0A3A4K6D3_9NOCA|nr:carotenoid oxygenase family protein [Nocardia panacis]RJO70040.1 9-cis-epoxycarotenoid dioxygenase [Nocardia panacis]